MRTIVFIDHIPLVTPLREAGYSELVTRGGVNPEIDDDASSVRLIVGTVAIILTLVHGRFLLFLCMDKCNGW